MRPDGAPEVGSKDGRRRGRVRANLALRVRTFREIAQRWQVRAEDFSDERLDTDLCFAVVFTGSGRQFLLEFNEPTLPLSPPSTVALDVLNHISTALSTIGSWERYSNRT